MESNVDPESEADEEKVLFPPPTKNY